MTKELTAEELAELRWSATRASQFAPFPKEAVLALFATIKARDDEIARLRDALEFYADPETYKLHASGSSNSWAVDYPIGSDEGEIARAALAGQGKAPEGTDD